MPGWTFDGPPGYTAEIGFTGLNRPLAYPAAFAFILDTVNSTDPDTGVSIRSIDGRDQR